jgi:hypothetical protein
MGSLLCSSTCTHTTDRAAKRRLYTSLNRKCNLLAVTEDRDHSRDTLLRMSVPEAASRLGVTQSAIRKRVQRDQIPYEKDARGHTYVYLDVNHDDRQDGSHDGSQSRDQDQSRGTGTGVTGPSHDAATERLLKHLEEQNLWLRQELERKDAILLSITQRIPELEPRGFDVSSAEGEGSAGPPPDDAGPYGAMSSEVQVGRPSWLRRVLRLD